MKKFTAVFCSLILHAMLVTSFAATSTAAVQIAADRAAHTLIG